MTVRRFLPIAVLLTMTATAVPAFAETPQADEARRPGQIAREGVDNLLRAFDRLVAAIPQYALPEVTERGDIVIRRKNPPAVAAPGSGQDVVDL